MGADPASPPPGIALAPSTVWSGPTSRLGVLNIGQASFEKDVHAATEQFECLRRLLTSKVRAGQRAWLCWRRALTVGSLSG